MDRTARIARQHLESSRLMGVTFVPLRSVGGDTTGIHIDGQRSGEASGNPTVDDSRAAMSGVVEPDLTQPCPSARIAMPLFGETAVANTPSAKTGDAAYKFRSLEDLRARHDAGCPHCTTVTYHTRTVFGEGNPD